MRPHVLLGCVALACGLGVLVSALPGWEEMTVAGAPPGAGPDGLSACHLVSWQDHVSLWDRRLLGSGLADRSPCNRHAHDRGLPLVEYEAAAVEWFLLGLVELPPEGVVPKRANS